MRGGKGEWASRKGKLALPNARRVLPVDDQHAIVYSELELESAVCRANKLNLKRAAGACWVFVFKALGSSPLRG